MGVNMKINTIENGEKGNTGHNIIRTGWFRKLRNNILIISLAMFIVKFLLNYNDSGGFIEFYRYILVKGIIPVIIISAYFVLFHWKYLNRIKEGTTGHNRIDTLWWILMAFFIFSGIYPLVTEKTMPLLDIVYYGFETSVLIYMVIIYPLTLYWEKKNGLIIYFVEDKPSKWRYVALREEEE